MNRKRTSQSYLLISHIKNQILLNGLKDYSAVTRKGDELQGIQIVMGENPSCCSNHVEFKRLNIV